MDSTVTLATDNLGLAGEAATSHKAFNAVYDWDDAYQDASIGLLRAAETWDPNGPLAFSTWAWPRMRAAIREGKGWVEGRSYRRHPEWHPAYRLDEPADPDGESFTEPASPVDVETEALSEVWLNQIADTIRAVCNAQDLPVAETVIAGGSFAEAAEAAGISRQAAHQRWKRIAARCSKHKDHML